MTAQTAGTWQRITRAAALSTMLLLTVTGCHKKTLPPPTALAPDSTSTVPAPTASITADPLAIELGQSLVLNWRTTNATSVSIDGIGEVSVNGTQTVSPANSTNFRLVAKGDGGVTEANVRVTVRAAEIPSTAGNTTGVSNGGDANDMSSVTDSVFHAAVPDVFFDYDSFDIRADAVSSITSAARFLSSHPGVKVLIGGYCDDRGSAEYNITLGENRANAARTALISAGVPAARIRVISYGKERQFCTEENESCWQQNRRAQFSVDR